MQIDTRDFLDSVAARKTDEAARRNRELSDTELRGLLIRVMQQLHGEPVTAVNRERIESALRRRVQQS
jgi:hypothetical protein